jgi:hypothetical protein
MDKQRDGSRVAEALRQTYCCSGKGSISIVAQVVPAYFLAFVNHTKVSKEPDHLSKHIPFDWHILLPAFKDLETFLIIGSSTYTRSLVCSGNRIKHPAHITRRRYLYLSTVDGTARNCSRSPARRIIFAACTAIVELQSMRLMSTHGRLPAHIL